MEKSGSDIAVATTELCKRYGQNIALDGTSFAVTKGSIFGIIGADKIAKIRIKFMHTRKIAAALSGFSLITVHGSVTEI